MDYAKRQQEKSQADSSKSEEYYFGKADSDNASQNYSQSSFKGFSSEFYDE